MGGDFFVTTLVLMSTLVATSATVLTVQLPPLVEAHPCSAAIERQLASWNVRQEVFRAPGGPLGGNIYRIATREVGTWVTMHTAAGNATVSLFLTDWKGSTRLDFGESCSPAPVTIVAPVDSSSRPSFTDADLRALLVDSRPLVVFLWSPHLPLSADGYREIEAATSALDARLVALVDPSADAGYVDTVAEESGIPVAARRRLDSVELLFRDLAVHAPAILIFANGKASETLPGYRNRDAYRGQILSFVEAIR